MSLIILKMCWKNLKKSRKIFENMLNEENLNEIKK